MVFSHLVCFAQRCGVARLHRSRFGEFDVEGLAPGEWRLLPLPPWTAAAAEAAADGVAPAAPGGAAHAEAEEDS